MIYPPLYKHKANTDVAVEVIHSQYHEATDDYKLYVYWWNIGPHTPFNMGVSQHLVIDASTWLADWKPYKFEISIG